jgi:hypothetical protein
LKDETENYFQNMFVSAPNTLLLLLLKVQNGREIQDGLQAKKKALLCQKIVQIIR